MVEAEKTREVTRPGQAGLSKIMSLSAVPAWRVTRSEGNPRARAKSGWITIRNLLCFELEQIRDHIYYTIRGHLYSNCGVQFVVATLG